VPCDGLPLSTCALSPQVGCENIPGLVQRAIDMTSAQAPAEMAAIREALSYPDHWVGPLPDGVLVELWLDPASPFAEDARERAAGLSVPAGSLVEREIAAHPERAAAIGVRATPTWVVGGYRLRGLQSPAAIQRLIDLERGS